MTTNQGTTVTNTQTSDAFSVWANECRSSTYKSHERNTMTTSKIEQLRNFVEFEEFARPSNGKQHIAAWALEEITRLRAALAAPATAPSHTEAEVQELLHDDQEMTEERFEISVRRILGVPAP